ncbi:MAG: hypothetical protein ACNA8P_12665 [Phycisphaerales bacterium]
MHRLTPAIALLALAGTTAITTGAEPTTKAPQQAQSPEQDGEARAESVRKWLRSLPLRGFSDLLPQDGLSQEQVDALIVLKSEPEFKQFLDAVPDSGRSYFSRYFAWQISTIRDGRSADGVLFAHTIMNDVARLKRFSELEIIQIGIERDRQFESLLQIARDQLEQQLRANKLSQNTIDDVMATFERSAANTKLYLTNPASAYCDLPSAPDDLERMRKYRHKELHRVEAEVSSAMMGPKPFRLARLKYAAAAVEQQVATDYARRIAWLEDPKTERPGIITAEMGQPGAFGLFHVEWGRFSHWRPSDGYFAGGGASPGSATDPEPEFRFGFRYPPATDSETNN